MTDLIVHGGRIATQDDGRSFASAAAVKDGRFLAVGNDALVMAHRGPETRVVDLGGRTVIPGLVDSHTHVVRGGLSYNMELRWDGVPSLADALRLLRARAARTPAPQWVRVVGGFTEFQFAEKRLPTLDELNDAAPETPVFVLHLYDRALLNRAALRAVGYTKDTPSFPGSFIERDAGGNPTGLLVAKPSAALLYATLARGPRLSPEDQANSTRHFLRELNRLGVTSVIDAGGGGHAYPEDYGVVKKLAALGLLTARIAYSLFTQHPRGELADLASWTKALRLGGDDFLRLDGAGEMLVYSAADFEDFAEPRPDLGPSMESDLEAVVRTLVQNRWPFRMHATYDETIGRALDAFERVDRDLPFDGLRWCFDHAETITARNIDRVRDLGGGIAVQHRMAYQGDYFVRRYGAKAALEAPPIRRMLRAGIPVAAGTDATRVASYNPFVALHWLVSGRTLGGLQIYQENRLDRDEALRLWTVAGPQFSGEAGKKGAIVPGQLADFAVLSADYFSIPEDEIKELESVLTVVGGKVVYAAGEFKALDPPLPPVSPSWSPVVEHGGHAPPTRAGGCDCSF